MCACHTCEGVWAVPGHTTLAVLVVSVRAGGCVSDHCREASDKLQIPVKGSFRLGTDF